jgi:hypothetical protein
MREFGIISNCCWKCEPDWTDPRTDSVTSLRCNGVCYRQKLKPLESQRCLVEDSHNEYRTWCTVTKFRQQVGSWTAPMELIHSEWLSTSTGTLIHCRITGLLADCWGASNSWTHRGQITAHMCEIILKKVAPMQTATLSKHLWGCVMLWAGNLPEEKFRQSKVNEKKWQGIRPCK